MRKKLVDMLRGRSGDELKLTIYEENSSHIIEGVLHESDDYWYPIEQGVPCLLRGGMRDSHESFRNKHNLPNLPGKKLTEHDKEQSLTNNTFSDKWRRFTNYGMQDDHEEFLFDWYCKKLGVSDKDELKQFYKENLAIIKKNMTTKFELSYLDIFLYPEISNKIFKFRCFKEFVD